MKPNKYAVAKDYLMSASPKKCKVGFLWDYSMETFNFGKSHPVRVGRFQMVRDFIEQVELLTAENISILKPEPLSESLLERIHAPEYLDEVRRISRTGEGEIDIDTPGFRGIYENALITTGATVTGVKAILSGEVDHFYSPTGGFHHAKYAWGGGFCVFNDIAAAIYELKSQGFSRVLVLDLDVHHGNGTQEYFYNDPDVMIISFHEDPEWLYPHDGFITDIGSDEGLGLNINMPFPMDSGDAVYRYAFDNLIPSLVEFFEPDFIFLLPGYDAHYRDSMSHLTLTTDIIRYTSKWIHQAAHKWSQGKLGVISGGGYHPEAFLWCAGTVLSVISRTDYQPPSQEPPFEDDDETWNIVKRNVSRVQELVFPILGLEK
ncbi:MAG: acetoin utilization protein AcuC [Candidatus Lokiarchaeota archaeon]|nr:acetoin utilization protein AcuC [Candidatus Lokiarchaeota archaeon]